MKRERAEQKQERQEQKRELKQQQRESKQREKDLRRQEKQAKHERNRSQKGASASALATRAAGGAGAGQAMPLRGGGYATETSSGARYEFTPDGRLSGLSLGGIRAAFRPNGHFSSVTANGIQINYGFAGGRTIQTRLPGGEGLVSFGPGRGFIESPISSGGRAYVERTYLINGRLTVALYRPYYYRGVLFYRYAPAFYYPPAFYGWAYYAWSAPVLFNWGWAGAPWFTFYQPYFAPNPFYPNASLWLTDYLLAQDLQAAYQDCVPSALAADGTAEGAPSDGGSPITPEVKLAIADEVREQLAADQAAASDTVTAEKAEQRPIPPALDPKLRVFIVSSSLSEGTSDGQACGLIAGDVIARLADTPDPSGQIPVSVLSSKQTDCSAGAQIAVSVQDLQEMNHEFRRQIDAGLEVLVQHQGRNGLPLGPDPGPTQSSADQPVMPETNAPALLMQQQQAADHAEALVRQEALSSAAARISQ